MGACLAFSSECDFILDERFNHCCDDEITRITFDHDGFTQLVNDLEVLTTSIYAIGSELLLADH